ncbi:MAG TPA: hypothetical protein VGQ75_01655 [Thermoanaerobaculia bacterium]|jgi:tetratricopeptide (TPR) repeat protein|nr:hypothetical protein [Thermoanaerobaculia bacterium]
MSRQTNAIQSLTTSLRQLPLFSSSRRGSEEEEVQLYVKRALRAAAEERYDVALVFCEKALLAAPGNLAARLLAGRLYDHVYEDVDRAVAAYRKVITLAGYDSSDPYCSAAREALDALVKDTEE